jgi:hypothetical protein
MLFVEIKMKRELLLFDNALQSSCGIDTSEREIGTTASLIQLLLIKPDESSKTTESYLTSSFCNTIMETKSQCAGVMSS